jgi:hypothetical protein
MIVDTVVSRQLLLLLAPDKGVRHSILSDADSVLY